jgi:hypothetical protein
MTSVTKTLSLLVPKKYTVDPWLTSANPEEVAIVLDLASRLPRIIGDEKNEMAAKLHAARDDATSETIKKVLEEASNVAAFNSNKMISELKVQCETIKSRAQQLSDLNEQYKKDLMKTSMEIDSLKTKHLSEFNTLQSKYASELKEKELTLKSEMEKNNLLIQHTEQTTALKIEGIKRDITLQSAKEYQQLSEEHLNLKVNFEILKDTTNQLILDARQEEINKASQRERNLKDANSNSYDNLNSLKMNIEAKLMEAVLLKSELSTNLSEQEIKHSKQVHDLNNKISELQNPLNRGSVGEFDVAQTLRDIGFHVEDTSQGARKDAGYLDLLVKADESSSENMRIAVEVKNKKTIKKASDEKVNRKDKDLDDDIRTFQIRAQNGIENNLFDAAVFVSIRAHTKMGAPVFLEMFNDTTNRPLAPVSYIGPEKSKVVVPLTQEQLETHMYMMFSVLEKCHTIQRDVCNGLKDEEITSFQTLFENIGTFLNKTFLDFRKQESLLHEMNTNLNSMRFKCIKMFRSIHNINGSIPWLQRKLSADWMPVYDTALERAASMSEADVWNRVCKHKNTIENTIGKEGMFMAIREELNSEPNPKRMKTDVTD